MIHERPARTSLVFGAALALAGCAAAPPPAPPPPEPPRATPPPPPTAEATPASPAGNPPMSTTSVVNQLRGDFLRCYKRGLEADPTQGGAVQITAHLDPQGYVTSAEPAARRLSTDVASCLAAVVSRARFPPPASGYPDVVVIPLTLILPRDQPAVPDARP